jgi:hypothetical protein
LFADNNARRVSPFRSTLHFWFVAAAAFNETLPLRDYTKGVRLLMESGRREKHSLAQYLILFVVGKIFVAGRFIG